MSMDWFYQHEERAPIRKQFDKPVCDTEIFGDCETQQSFAEECDINTIMRRYQETGIATHLNKYEGKYGEFTDVVDYQTACNVVIQANEMFETLPSSVREKFANDPANFLAFVDNPDNADGLIEMGLARVREPSDTDRVVDAIRDIGSGESDDIGTAAEKASVKKARKKIE